MSANWTDNVYGEGLHPDPYVAVDGYYAHLWVNGVRWDKDCFWTLSNGGTALDIAVRTGLPVFTARRDHRRRDSFMWLRAE